MSGNPFDVVVVVVAGFVASVEGKAVKLADGSTVFFISSRRFSSSLLCMFSWLED